MDSRTPILMWDEDSVKNIYQKPQKTPAFLNAISIDTINNVKSLSIIDLEDISTNSNDTNLTLNKFLKLQESCLESQHGYCPHVSVHFPKDENQYRARYGETWQEEIKKVQFLSPYICITDLINHIMSATKEVISGTKYKGQELFFHDALSLMTAKDTVTWMKEKGIYEH